MAESASQPLGQEDKLLEKALQTAGLGHLYATFATEKVTVQVIPLLSDEDLLKLGVESLGERVVLKDICKNLQKQESVAAEMRNVFPAQAPVPSSSNSSHDSHETVLARAERMLTNLRSGPLTLPSSRRHRRHLGKSRPRTHQRNVVVIDFAGAHPPAVQSFHNYDKVYEGVLRFDGSMTEMDVREEICRLARDTKTVIHDMSAISCDDFIFVKVVNRRIWNPAGNGVYDGNGLKELYRSGNIYVRLTKSFDKHTVSLSQTVPHDHAVSCLESAGASNAPVRVAPIASASHRPLTVGATPATPAEVLATNCSTPAVSTPAELLATRCPAPAEVRCFTPRVATPARVLATCWPASAVATPTEVLATRCPAPTEVRCSTPPAEVLATRCPVPGVATSTRCPDLAGVRCSAPGADMASHQTSLMPLIDLTEPSDDYWSPTCDVEPMSDDLSDSLQQSIENSIRDSRAAAAQQEVVHDLSIKDVLKAHAERYLTIDPSGERQEITVRRKHIWYDTKRFMKRRSFKCQIGLDVHFLGEDGQDAGGPLREYFRLLWKDIAADGSVVEGPEERRHLRHNTMSFRNDVYLLIGRCIGLSVIYGGGGPHFFSPAVVRYLLDEPVGELAVEEVADFEIRAEITKISECESVSALREALDSDACQFRFDAGVCMPSCSVQFGQKDVIVQDLVAHYLVHSCKSELDQLKQGCSELGLLSLLRTHPTLFKPLLISEGKMKLTARYVETKFRVKWSPQGSNARDREAAVVMAWKEYLDGVEGGRLVPSEDPQADADEGVTITLEKVFAFATAGDHEPPQGFDNTPEIRFEPRRDRCLPTACTCFPLLILPILLTDPEEFRCKMDYAIINGSEFGNP